MPISFDDQSRIFHLYSAQFSYIIKIYPSGIVGNLYWGKYLAHPNADFLTLLADKRLAPEASSVDYEGLLDICPQEYPVHGTSDFRAPAVVVGHPDGSIISDLRYRSHRIFSGKPPLAGLPATWANKDDQNVQTLEIVLCDQLYQLDVILRYSVFAQHHVLTRSVCCENRGPELLNLERVLSAAIDLHGDQYRELHLAGSWARERDLKISPVLTGSHAIDSSRGSSSHQQNPFIALLAPTADEDHGEVYAFNLIYSGNFLATVEVDQFAWTRVLMGINPQNFSWSLEPGASFQAPEVVMVYSDQGLGLMSRRFHRLYREHLVRGAWQYKERPILINNWEATYFNFTADRIEGIAKAAAPLGIELFVLDDGWFGHRDKDNSSLGDWFVDQRKLPAGLADLVTKIKQTGLNFGLWFEPEMISMDSELYKAHPDWCLHVPGRKRTEIRTQLVLDLSRKEVRDYIVEQVCAVLASAPISYVKWDMNRPMTEVGSAAWPAQQQREISHRYILGVYEMMAEITGRFPEVLFESCAGGGARFDPGILYYMPQIWASDNTDAIERLKIQYGTCMVYPPSVMGAHVSAVANHQTGRMTPLETRGYVALAGVFGYELDATSLTLDEQEMVRQQIVLCKATRHLVMTGDYYRLLSPWEGNQTAWILVSPDQGEAMVTWVRVLGEPNPSLYRVRLKGLDRNAHYRVEGPETTCVVGADHLMQIGLRVPAQWGDFKSCLWRLFRT